MDRIPVTTGDVIGVTNDADVGPVAVSYTAGSARILRRPINSVDRRTATGRPRVGNVYEFSVVPFALEFSLNADIGQSRLRSTQSHTETVSCFPYSSIEIYQ